MLNRKRDYVQGNTLYPSPTAGNGKLSGVVDLYNSSADTYRAKCCGFLCDPKRVGNPGTINEGDGDITRVAVTGGFEPVVGTGGCPFCGSGNSR